MVDVQRPASIEQNVPRQSGSSVRQTGDCPALQRRLQQVRVLVVDGDVVGANDLCTVLSLEGCDARTVRSAEEALALLTAFPAQAVVLNLVLPRMSGLLLARRLKASLGTRDILLFSMSPAQWGDAEQIAREAGCLAHLSKPVDADSFVDRLAAAVGGRS